MPKKKASKKPAKKKTTARKSAKKKVIKPASNTSYTDALLAFADAVNKASEDLLKHLNK